MSDAALSPPRNRAGRQDPTADAPSVLHDRNASTVPEPPTSAVTASAPAAARGHRAGFEDQRERILAGAARLFADQGFAATSMNQIAEAAGLSKPALYHYVADKEALLVGIAEPHLARLDAIVQRASDASDGTSPAHASAALRRLIETLVADYAHAQAAHRVLTEDVRFLAETDRRRLEATERGIVHGVARLVERARPDLAAAGLGRPLTMLLFGMVNWMFKWLRPGGPMPHAALAPLVADLFLGGLRDVQVPAAAASPREHPDNRAPEPSRCSAADASASPSTVPPDPESPR